MEIQESIWGRAKSLVVFYVFKDPDDFQEFRVALDAALIDTSITRLKVMIQVQDRKEVVLRHSLFSYITEKDLSYLTNSVKKRKTAEGEESLENIRSSHFDLLICFGSPSKKVGRWLTKMKVDRKIGVNSDFNSFFDLNLQSSADNPLTFVGFTTETLNRIK
jgi:hypothetical protein